MERTAACMLVIFGASGDLTKRKLIPELFALQMQNLLPDNFVVLGIGRTGMDDSGFRNAMADAINRFSPRAGNKNGEVTSFTERLFYLTLETKDPAQYHILKDKIDLLDQQYHTAGNIIFYLATPPNMYNIIPKALKKQNLHRSATGWRRIIVEKPFGLDYDSAKKLNKELRSVFDEDQIYRIDHYLGKETAQNILVTRFSNGIFEPLWNRNYIDHIEITSVESIGVENRGGYYDQSGALRDMVQNHLLQLTALVAMEPPSSFDSDSIRNETLKVFQSLRPLNEKDIEKSVIRGQYTESVIRGDLVKGYRSEKGVDPNSRTETFLAMKFFIDNWRWGGVPFYIRTGKRLPTRVTEIVVHFKKTPHTLFSLPGIDESMQNQLIIRIQPDEGIVLKFGMKIPGSGFKVKNVAMDFHYSDLSDAVIPDAYERLLYDCMQGDSTLYIRGDALEAAWKFVKPVQDAWAHNPDIKVYGYPAGTWGPEHADSLIEGKAGGWRYPCKNLSNDGLYCEL